jgi:uncharacterized protein (UPF0332 family)
VVPFELGGERMTGRDFLSVALTLAADSSEAAWRSAISRAYYAAFHVARELLINLGFKVAGGSGTHDFLWLRLQNSGDPLVKRAGSNLNVLRGLRNKADYDLRRRVAQAIAQNEVSVAEQIIQTLEAASIDPTRTQITDAMRIFERDVLKEVTWHP